MAEYSCGVTEAYSSRNAAMAADVKLQTNRPLYLIRESLPGRTLDQTAMLYEKAFARWGKADIKTRRITDLAEAGPFDVVNVVSVADLGSAGVLADQQLPNGSTRILPMRMNSRITWTETDGAMNSGLDPVRVFCHEQGHFLGHEHWPRGAPPELMEPFINDQIIAPQPTEMAVTVGWFGNAGEPQPPIPVPDGPCKTVNDCLKTLRNALASIQRGREFIVAGTTLNQEFSRALQAVGELPCDKIVPLITAIAAAFQACQPQPLNLPCAGLPCAATAANPCAALAGLLAICSQLGPILKACPAAPPVAPGPGIRR